MSASDDRQKVYDQEFQKRVSELCAELKAAGLSYLVIVDVGEPIKDGDTGKNEVFRASASVREEDSPILAAVAAYIGQDICVHELMLRLCFLDNRCEDSGGPEAVYVEPHGKEVSH